MNDRRPSPAKMLGFFAMLLLPLILLGGSTISSALAEARLPASAPATDNPPPLTFDEGVVMRVYFRSDAERDRLATELGAEEFSTSGGYIVIVKDMETYNSLRAQGLRVEIDYTLTGELNRPRQLGLNSPDTFYGGYRTVEEIYAFLDAKVAAYPTLAEKVDIGDSWCKTHPGVCTSPGPAWNGFDLYVLHITNRNIPGPKPVFWYDAGIHSREIATPEVAMRFIDYILNNYNTDADARWLVDHHDIWVMPSLNPDGHHIVETGGNNPTMHRKNGDSDDGCPRTSTFGVDINRNFPFLWGCCGGSSSSPCSETYRGPGTPVPVPGPGTPIPTPVYTPEEETQFMMAKVRQLIPDQRGNTTDAVAPITTTGTLINMHSNAQQNLYPWGYTSQYAPNRTDLRNIGRHMSSPQVRPVGNGYEYCQNTECLYVVDGDEKNWAYGELGIPGYSLEVAGSGFFPPFGCIDNPPGVNCSDGTVGLGLWPQNRGALLYHAKIVRQPYLLTRGPDAYTSSNVPMVVEQGVSANLTSTINYNWSGYDGQPNAYLQNVAAAEYYIDTPPWAGGVAVPMNADDGAYDETTEGVNASIPTGSLSIGRHVVFVRGRGVTSYEGFQSWGPIGAVFLDVQTPGLITATPTPTNTSTPIITSTSTRTNTPTSTRTNTPTGNTPTPTATFFAPCGALPQGNGLTSCQTPPGTYSYSFTFYVESGCTQPVTGPATFYFYISNNPLGPFTLHDTFSRTVTFPAGPNMVTFSGNFIETNIPQGNLYYRLDFSATNLRAGANQSTGVANLCANVTPTPGSPTPSPTPCALQFTDVPVGHTFYDNIRCLACRGIINGYTSGCATGDPCFRPENNVTRGQVAKIVSNAAGFSDPITAQSFEDVPSGHTFFDYIGRLSMRGIVGGYACGGPGEPCVPPLNLPYYRPGDNVTRGQLSKIVSEAAGFNDVPSGQQFEDVAIGSTFYAYIYRLYIRSIMSGYVCGGTGEPCVPPGNLPYFRPGSTATRGQTAKIVANTFYPACVTPRR